MPLSSRREDTLRALASVSKLRIRIPLWVAPLVGQAATMKCDARKRYKAYKLIRRRLWDKGVGMGKTRYPTYVYPQELKQLLRTVFPEGVCNYPDPDHSKVVRITLEDLHLIATPAVREEKPSCGN